MGGVTQQAPTGFCGGTLCLHNNYYNCRRAAASDRSDPDRQSSPALEATTTSSSESSDLSASDIVIRPLSSFSVVCEAR